MIYKLFFKKAKRPGFTLAEIIVSVAIIGILFVGMSAVIANTLSIRKNAEDFIKAQSETDINVEILSRIIKNSKNILTYIYPSQAGEAHNFDVLLIQNSVFSHTPFTLVRPVAKNVNSNISYLKLDSIQALKKGVDTLYYLGISPLYFYSGVATLDDIGQDIIFPDPESGKLKAYDNTVSRRESQAYARTVDFGANPNFIMPVGIAKKDNSTFYISDRADHTIWEVHITSVTAGGEISATKNRILGVSGQAGSLTCADAVTKKVIPSSFLSRCSVGLLNQPSGIKYKNNILYIADSANHRILSYSLGSNTLQIIAGNDFAESGMSPNGTSASNAYLNTPTDVAIDSVGTVYISDTFNHRILRVDSGHITIVAGMGQSGFSGDFGMARLAKLSFPTGLSFYNNELYISDSGNNIVRKIGSDNRIQTFIGNVYATKIASDFPSSLLSVNGCASSPQCPDPDKGQSMVVNRAPKASNKEYETVIQCRDPSAATCEPIEKIRLLYANQSFFYFNTGLFITQNGDAFIVDSVNNQIKMMPNSNLIFSYSHVPQPHLPINLGTLTQDQVQYKVFPIVRREDFGAHNFVSHPMTLEDDYISPNPIKHMYFQIFGIMNRILQANIAGLSSEEDGFSSNNFQFSLSLRNPVDFIE